MLDHQVGEAGAVDEDDFLVYGLCVIVSVLHEIAGRDEDTFGGLLTSTLLLFARWCASFLVA